MPVSRKASPRKHGYGLGWRTAPGEIGAFLDLRPRGVRPVGEASGVRSGVADRVHLGHWVPGGAPGGAFSRLVSCPPDFPYGLSRRRISASTNDRQAGARHDQPHRPFERVARVRSHPSSRRAHLRASAANSSCIQPTPTPIIRRPPDSRSIEAATRVQYSG